MLLDAQLEKLVESWPRGSRCQHRSFVGTSLLVETVLESGGTCCHARSQTGAKGSDRSRTHLEVILNTQRDSESEQQNDVDMTGAGAGASGAATAASGASAGMVTGEKKKAQEEAKRRMERIQAALTQLGSETI